MGMISRRAAAAVIVSVAVLLTACTGPSATSKPTLTPTVVVPDLVGLNGSEARDQLDDLHLVHAFDAGEDTVIAASNWTVDTQNPAAGTSVPEESTVTLAVSKPERTGTPTVVPAPPAPAVQEPATEAPAPAAPQRSVTYSNCTDARNAGAAPIYEGQPGYSTKLDRDHDGIACE